MIQSNTPITIPDRVEDKLREVRGTRDRTRLIHAVVLGLLALFLAMAMAMFIDWAFTLFDTFWRSMLTLAALATAGGTLMATAVAGYYRRRELADVATDVDRSVPVIEERWSTVAELAAAPLDQQRRIHTGMLNRLSEEATRLEPSVVPQEVVQKRGLRYSLTALCGVVLLLLVAFVIDWQQTSVLVQRFWAPTANISATQLTVPANQVVAARGEPLSVKANMKGRLVEEATLFLKEEGTGEQEIILEATGTADDQFVHHIKAAAVPISYRLRAGDGQTEWQSVAIADRPEIAEVRFRAIPPAYTGKEPVEMNELPEKVSIIEGSTLEVSLLPRAPVEEVVFRMNEDDSAVLSSPDGRWYQFNSKLEDSLTIAAILTESHGLENRHPPVCRINVYPDKAPSVKIVTPTEEMAARPDDEIEIQFSASDDLGIAKAELVIYDESSPDDGPQELQVIEIPLGSQQDESEVSGSVPLDLEQFNFEDGQELSYAVRVYDTRQSTASTDGSPSTAPREETRDVANASPQGEQGDSPAASNTPPESAAEEESAQVASNQSTASPSASSANDPKNPSEGENPGKATSATPEATPANETSTVSTQPAGSAQAEDNEANSNAQSGQPASASLGTPEPSERADGDSNPQRSAETNVAATQPEQSEAQDNNGSSKSGSPSENAQNSQATASNGSSNTNSSPPPGKDAENLSEMTGAPRPPDNMTRRSLDVAQSASSGMMRLKIDKWSGSFAGQQRRKLEIAVAGTLNELDQVLEVAENRLREGLDDLENDVTWVGTHDRLLHVADGRLDRAFELITDVRSKSDDTAYAFIGLQLEEIGDTNLVPAKDAVWGAVQATSNQERKQPVEIAWQQIGRARQRLTQLVTQFERIRREHALADSVEQVKEMYQVFVEDSFALLNPEQDAINNYQRKRAEFELDEEYLKRLEEVLAMRQKLVAEFARILSQDPRLLRRFTDALNNEADDLRDQLTLLTLHQQEVDAQIHAWKDLEPKLRPRALVGITRQTLEQSIDIGQKVVQVQEDFDTWVPLNLGANESDVAAARKELAAIAASARNLESKAAAWGAPAKSSEDTDKTAEADEDDESQSLTTVTTQGRDLYQHLQQLDALLLDLSTRTDNTDLGPFVVRRLAETRRLITDVSSWIYQLEALNDGRYHTAKAVEQQKLAQETTELTANLADVEQQLAQVVGGDAGELPVDIADLARALLRTLDERVAGSQLGAVFSLRRNKMDDAGTRTRSAVEGMVEAERLFDELMKRTLEEADKLPVQDPIADLLDDPTLDELLALLENEADLAAALRIPRRPTNLQIIGDFLSSGSGGGGGGGSRGMVMSQLSATQRMMQRAGQRALNRVKAETDKLAIKRARKIDDWNKLASELENRLLQGQGQLPPERYGRAIEQYFEELSRKTAAQSEVTP